jgi:hypothetical protein
LALAVEVKYKREEKEDIYPIPLGESFYGMGIKREAKTDKIHTEEQ